MYSEFLPVCRADLDQRKWRGVDVLLINPDPYIDHPSIGVSVVGRFLEKHRWRVGMISQPDWRSSDEFVKLGAPELWCGISGGTVDSVLSNYTVNRKKRRRDMFGPAGKGGFKPMRASVVYANVLRSCFPGIPLVLGGIEATTRRFAHYDWWKNEIRRSILFDARADCVVWGEGELAALHITERLSRGEVPLWGIPGTTIRIRKEQLREVLSEAARYMRIEDVTGEPRCTTLISFPGKERGVRFLPSYEELCEDKDALLALNGIVEEETRGPAGAVLVQPHGAHLVVSFPRMRFLTQEEFDAVSELPYTRMQHPEKPEAPAVASVRNSVITQRGCPGGCTFCAIRVHFGAHVRSRSCDSVLREIRQIAAQPFFRGTITDLGGPTANLYGMGCGSEDAQLSCRRASCLWPDICPHFRIDPAPFAGLLQQARAIPGVNHVYVASGIRHDVLLKTPRLLDMLVKYHISGRIKFAPEHAADSVLYAMRKPPIELFTRAVKEFQQSCVRNRKHHEIAAYFLSSFPGSTDNDMWEVMAYLQKMGLRVEQVQDFWPAPLTPAAAMYWAEKDAAGRPIHVAKTYDQRKRQKACVRYHDPRNRRFLKELRSQLKRSTRPEDKQR